MIITMLQVRRPARDRHDVDSSDEVNDAAAGVVPGHRRTREQALIDLAGVGGATDLDTPVELLEGPDRSAFLHSVVRHRLQAPLADALRRAGHVVPPEIASTVDADQLTRLRILALLDRAGTALESADLAWLTMKGPGVAALMPRPELRSFNDLDLLVGAEDFARALDVLDGAGVREVNRNWQPYIDHVVGETPLDAGGVTVDLHWDLIGLAQVRATLRLDTQAMLSRREPVRIGDTNAYGFDAEDQLLHLAVHCALDGAASLAQLRDLACVAGARLIDWDEFLRRARRRRRSLRRAPLRQGGAGPRRRVPSEVITELGRWAVVPRRALDRLGVSQWRGLAVTSWRRRAAPRHRGHCGFVSGRSFPGTSRAGTSSTRTVASTTGRPPVDPTGGPAIWPRCVRPGREEQGGEPLPFRRSVRE
ncbi:MAG: nucleotidyltransferase family protein [Acidimicrobiales bacterium]